MEQPPLLEENTNTKRLRKEFDFNQKRFSKMAEKYADRSIVQKVIDWNKKMSEIDFEQEEAVRDNADFERRKGEEFQAWEKNLKVVVDNLIEKRDSKTEKKDIRPLLLILGGGMKGPYSAGQALIGLPAIGLDSKFFDAVVGISAGADVASYFVAGGKQMPKGASVFYEECTEGEFIDFRRVNQIMNVEVISNVMSKGEKAVDQQAILDSKTKFYVGVTGAEDGKSELIDVKTAKPGMMDALTASMAVPLVYRKAIEVNGKKYVDGAFDPMPIEKIIEKFNPTDILVLPNTPFDRMDAFELTPGEYLFAELSSKMGSVGSAGSLDNVEKFLLIKEEVRKSLEYIQKQKGVNVGILWPPDSGLSNFTTDPDKVEEAVIESARNVIDIFGAEQPENLNLFHKKLKI